MDEEKFLEALRAQDARDLSARIEQDRRQAWRLYYMTVAVFTGMTLFMIGQAVIGLNEGRILAPAIDATVSIYFIFSMLLTRRRMRSAGR